MYVDTIGILFHCENMVQKLLLSKDLILYVVHNPKVFPYFYKLAMNQIINRLHSTVCSDESVRCPTVVDFSS